jgi:hypothetical protein
MNERDVDGDDMAHPELSDQQLAALLGGSAADLDGHPVADAIGSLRADLASEPAPAAGAALSEFLAVGHVAPTLVSSVTDTTPVVVPLVDEPDLRRTPVLATLSTFLGTLAGKLFVGTSIAAASVGAAHAGGVIDLPGLPDIDTDAIVETIDDDFDDTDDFDDDNFTIVTSTTTVPATPTITSTPTTSVPTTSVPSTTAPPVTVPTTTVPSTSLPTTTVPDTSTTAPASQTYPYTVTGVGTTVVEWTGSQLVLISATPAAGWILDEAGPDIDGVESTYTQGQLETRIDFEIEDGQVQVRIRTRDDDTDERTERFEYFPLP